ncbi:uncharacterized protein BYT42DRAFT_572184, partial [Radiomyces spectabilis]|uniref:uncharacterized protein n=1 Tax=Radiomyces spectabilis TaxID=64574 RepID=UPI0022204C05
MVKILHDAACLSLAAFTFCHILFFPIRNRKIPHFSCMVTEFSKISCANLD